MDFEKVLKRAACAYVGAMAYAYEATKKAVDACVEKGAATINDLKPKGEAIATKVKKTVNEKLPKPKYFSSLSEFVDSLSDEEKDEIREKLSECLCGDECSCEDECSCDDECSREDECSCDDNSATN